MDFEIPQEYVLLRDQFRRFLEKEIRPYEEKYKFENAVPYEVHMEVRRLSRKAGFYGIHLPEEVGGGGLDIFGYVLLLEELGKSLIIHFSTDIIGGAGGPTPILLDGSEEQIEKYLKPLIRAEKTMCFALTEPGAGSDATAIKTRAVKKNGRYVINGRKHFITNAPYADFALVFAVTDPSKGIKGITGFIVEKGTPGFEVGRIHETMTGTRMHGELIFEDCEVGEEQVLGKEGMGFIQAMKWITLGRLVVAAQCTGSAQGALDLAVKWAKERVAFGRPIARYQAIQWMVADSATEIFAAKSILYSTAWKASQGMDVRKESAMAKVYASEMAGRVIDRALQIHGGMGFMRELPIARLYQVVRAARIGEGTSEIQRLTIARRLLEEY